MKNFGLLLLGKSGPVIIIFLSVLPVYWWAPYANFETKASALRSLGQVTALTGMVLFSVNFILSARFRWMEHFFFGLNRMYITHHLYGAVAFCLLLLHPVFLTLSYLMLSLESAAVFILPAADNLPVMLGEIAILTLATILFLTFYVPLEYDLWKKTHTWIGLPLAVAFVHVYLTDTTVAENPALRWYMFLFFGLALGAYLRRLFSKISTRGRYTYSVTGVKQRGNITILTMDPAGEKLNYLPGQFVFLVFDHLGVPKQSHPFSITSDPDDNHLTFAIKSVGDYTETLKLLTPGTQVLVEGPYGRFSWKFYTNPDQVWIAGGIGITPFLGMLSSLTETTHTKVDLFYCVRDKDEAVFDPELTWCVGNVRGFSYSLWPSAENGRLTGRTILETVAGAGNREFFLCGPAPMMHGLARQLIRAGVKRSRIHTEEFSLQ